MGWVPSETRFGSESAAVAASIDHERRYLQSGTGDFAAHHTTQQDIVKHSSTPCNLAAHLATTEFCRAPHGPAGMGGAPVAERAEQVVHALERGE
jgi:hypothetical protein